MNAMHDEDAIVAIRALGWTLTDERRAERLLAMTGLDPAELRAGAGDPALLAAVLGFLAAHEPDLVACAAALELPVAELAALGQRLDPTFPD
jgi:hypothetical protein